MIRRELKKKKTGSRKRIFKKKSCPLCAEKGVVVDYKDTERLSKFITEKGKIIPRRISGACSKHQRHVARAIRRSRHAALMPFQAE